MAKILQLEDDQMQVDMYRSWFRLEFPDLQWDFATKPPPLETYRDYDAVFIDFRMGAVNGGDIAMQIKAAYPELPFTIVSGNPPEFILEQFPDLLPEQVLDKSGIEEFTAGIRKALQRWDILPA